ncbi:MAG: hypothetical protein GKR93_17940 [Gammaproteobacteria bacterium]|nr:hypothetical protein [Gammaproteobacteria bacterium]
MLIKNTVLCVLLPVFVIGHNVYSAPSHKRNVKSPEFSESVTTSANCQAGYVIDAAVKTSKKKVKIVGQTKIGCNSIGQCTSYQVTAHHPEGKSYSIEIDLTCSGDEKDSELNRLLEIKRKYEEANK